MPMFRRGRQVRRDPTIGRLAWLWAGEARVRSVAVLALAAGVGYLAWRVGATLGGAALWLALPLLLAEMWGFLQLGSLTVQAWRVPEADDATNEPVCADVVVISTSSDDPVASERTLLGCEGLDGVNLVVSATAEEFGRTLDRLDAEHVLVLRAGEVPAPDVLRRASTAMIEADVVAIQLAVEFINEDSLAHLFTGRSERDLVNRVIGPSLGARGLAEIAGSAFVARREAVRAAAEDGVLPAPPVLGARLLARGRCCFARAIVRSQGPDTLEEYLSGARPRARSALRALPRALDAVGANARARVALIAGSARYLAGVRSAVLLAVLVGALASGGAPLRASLLDLALVWVPTYLLATAAGIALGRGTIGLGDRTRHGLRSIGVHCSALFGRTRQRVERGASGGLAAMGRMGALTGAVLAVDALLIARGLDQWIGIGLPAFPGDVEPVVLLVGVLALASMLDVLQLVATRRQDRRAYRLVSDLPATLDGAPASARDISPGGVRVVLSEAGGPRLGDEVALRIDAPAQGEVAVSLDAVGLVRNVRSLPDGRSSVGVELIEMGGQARRALLCLYWVILPSMALPPASSVEGATERGRSAGTGVLASGTGRIGLRIASGLAAVSAAAAVLPASLLGSPAVPGAPDVAPTAPAVATPAAPSPPVSAEGPPGASTSTADATLPAKAADPPRAIAARLTSGRLQIRMRLRVRDRALCRGACATTVVLYERGRQVASPRRVVRPGPPLQLGRSRTTLRPPAARTVTLGLSPARTSLLMRKYGPGAQVPVSAEMNVWSRKGVVSRHFSLTVPLEEAARRPRRVTGQVTLGP